MKRIYTLTFLFFAITAVAHAQAISANKLLEMKNSPNFTQLEQAAFYEDYYYRAKQEKEDGTTQYLFKSIELTIPEGANDINKGLIATMNDTAVVEMAYIVFTAADVDVILKQFLALGFVVGETEKEGDSITTVNYSCKTYPALNLYVATQTIDGSNIYMVGLYDK